LNVYATVEGAHELLLGSAKIAVDEKRALVLDSGRSRTKTAYFWVIAGIVRF
jgi:hypothetical protein